jgi:hypothetical protein
MNSLSFTCQYEKIAQSSYLQLEGFMVQISQLLRCKSFSTIKHFLKHLKTTFHVAENFYKKIHLKGKLFIG